MLRSFSEYRQEQKLEERLEKKRLQVHAALHRISCNQARQVKRAKEILLAESKQDKREWKEMRAHSGLLLDGESNEDALRMSTNSDVTSRALALASSRLQGQSASKSDQELDKLRREELREKFEKKRAKMWGESSPDEDADTTEYGSGRGVGSGAIPDEPTQDLSADTELAWWSKQDDEVWCFGLSCNYCV